MEECKACDTPAPVPEEQPPARGTVGDPAWLEYRAGPDFTYLMDESKKRFPHVPAYMLEVFIWDHWNSELRS